MKSRKTAAGIIILTLALGPIFVALILFSPSPLAHVSLCLPHAATSALPVLADRLGYFQNEGLVVDLEVSSLGKTCVEGLIARQYDFAVSNVAPAVDAIVMANPLIVISELNSSSHQSALVYPQSKDTAGEGFSGNLIAIVAGTDGEMQLKLYTKERPALRIEDMHVVKVHSYREAAEMLEQGQVHGAILREPMLSEFVHTYPENEFMVDESAFYTSFGLLLSHNDVSIAHPDLIDKVVHALLEAQKFAEGKGEQARTITLDALQIEDSDSLRAFWRKVHFGVGLSSVLIAMMNQAESAFASMKELAPAETSNINIYQSLYPQALRKINSELVTYE